MTTEYVEFRHLMEKSQKLYSYALYGCERKNSEAVRKLALEYKSCQTAFERRFLDIADLSEPDNQRLQYEDIVASRPTVKLHCHKLYPGSLTDKMFGAVVGRLAGCTLGVPVESWNSEDILDMASQFGDDFPPTDYWSNTYYPSRLVNHGWAVKGDYTKNRIDGAPVDDDIGFTILDLLVLEKYGAMFETSDVAEIWNNHLPFAHTAEGIALDNIKHGIPIQDVATHGNPYVEWIGGYIRSDGWAWSCPGNPHKAAEFAWRDSYLTHRKNGIYGAMFFAAVEAAAFTEESIEAIIEIGLQYIPENCNLAIDIRWALSQKGNIDSWLDAVHLVKQRFHGMARAHTNNNACLVVFGLFLGEKNFTKTIGNVVAMGYDTDCNAATAGSIVGAMIGKRNIEEKWYLPFHGILKSYIKGQETISIDDFVSRYLAQAQCIKELGE